MSLKQNRLDNLSSWRSELESELAELKSVITRAHQDIELKESQLKNVLSLLQTGSASEKSDLPESNLPDKGFIDAAYVLLQASVNRNPLHYKSIADNLLAAGVYIPGEDSYAYLLTNISRDQSRFQRVGRGMYALTEWGMSTPRKTTKPKSRKPAKGKSSTSGRTRRS